MVVGYESNNNVCNLTKICMEVRGRTVFKRCRTFIQTENEVITKNQPTDMITSNIIHKYTYTAEQPETIGTKVRSIFYGPKNLIFK